MLKTSLALHQHHDEYGVFPSNGGWDGSQTIQGSDGQPTVVYTWDNNQAAPYYWGVGDPNLSPHRQTGSWAYAILPFIEQEAIHDGRAWGTPVRLYFCPARRQPLPLAPVDDQYAKYNGGGWQWAKIDYAANGLMIPNRPRCLRFTDMTDGSSHTILVGEKAMNPNDYERPSWYWDEPYFTGGSGGTQRFGSFLLRDIAAVGLSYRDNWGSPHQAGARKRGQSSFFPDFGRTENVSGDGKKR